VISPRTSVVLAVLLMAAHATTLAIWGDRGPGPLLSNSVQLAFGLVNLVTAASAARGRSAFERAFFYLVAGRSLIWGVAQALATYYVVADIGLDGSPADFLFHLASVPLGIALFLHTRHTAAASERAHPLDLAQILVFWAAIALNIHFVLTGTGPGIVATEALLAGCFYFRAMTSRASLAGAMFGRWTPAILMSTVNDGLATYYDALPGGSFDFIWSIEILVWLLTAVSWNPTRAAARHAAVDRTVSPLPLVVAGTTLVVALGLAQHRPAPALAVAGGALACLAGAALHRRFTRAALTPRA
jgi:hypothetical protein